MYLCKTLIDNICIEYVEYVPPKSAYDQMRDDFANLSYAEVTALWASVLLLFCVAYVFKHLSFFVRRR